MNDEGLKKYRNVVLMAEIGALIHDLGKMSEEFIKSKSKNSKADFDHHLILRRLISMADPCASSQSTEKDLVLCLIKQLDFFNELQLNDPGQLARILGDIERELKDPSRQSNLQSIFGEEFGQHILGSLVKNKQKNEKEDIEKIFAQIKKLREYIKKEKRILTNFMPSKVKQILNADLKNHFAPLFVFQKQTESVGDFIEMHHETWHQDLPFLIKLLKAPGCDGVDSSIDKNSPIEKQEFLQAHISTAFGYDKNRIVPSSLTQERMEFCDVLELQLKKIIDGEEKTVENAIAQVREEIMESAKKHFSGALGETRRAANDVTLWDHSYSVASLLKAALAGIILEHESSDSYTLPQPRELRWKILSVNINGLDFWMKSEKIGDIIARKNLIEECFDKIKDLFETGIPLGNEIYRDENCISFLVYDKFSEDLRLESENMTIKEKIISIFAKYLDSELKPHVDPSEESRGAATIGELLGKARRINNPLGRDIEQHWGRVKSETQENSKSEVEICRVCGIRAVELPHNKKLAKAEERHMCEICFERRKKRSKEWMEGVNKKDTIWIDEAADPNNRIALIIGKFDLGNWLDGTYLDTMFTKTLFDLHNSIKKDPKKKGMESLERYFHLLDAAKQSFSTDEIAIGQLRISTKEFLESIGQESYDKEKKTDEYFEAIVLDREKEKLEKRLGDSDKWDIETKARLLLSFLFRKNPSFARTRRLWETTLNFWEEVEDTIKNTKKRERLLSVDQRYQITFKEELEGIVEHHAYYLNISGTLVPVVAFDRRTLLVVEKKENLPKLLVNPITDKEKKVKEEIEVLESDKETSTGKAKIEDVREHSTYIPYINILREPTVFVSLLPAEKAFEAVRQIKEKYETEFSKVKNRLPLNLYIVFMNKKMPLYIALDSAKRFLQFKNTEEPFEIIGMCDKKLKNGEFRKKGLTLKGRRILETEFDLTLGNGEIDYYHPYFIIERARCPDQRPTYFETYLKQKLLHIKDLVATDIVRYKPSFFDFVFLDSNTRRFDISTEEGGRPHTIFKKGPRPYYLEDIDKIHQIWEVLKKYCDNTQLNNFDALLLSKIEEWNLKDLDDLSKNEEFRKLAGASIRNILRIDNEDDFEVIFESVLSGMFFDVKELYHTILKKELRGDEHE